MFFSRAKKGAQTLALIDVGSVSVGGSLVTVAYEGTLLKLTEHKRVREDVLADAALSPADERTRVLAALDAVLQALSGSTPRPHAAHMLLRAPYYSSQVHTATATSEQPQVTTSQELATLITHEGEQFLQGVVLPLWGEGGKCAIEHMLLTARVEGYHVRDPRGLAAKKKEYVFYFSAAQADFAHELESRVSAAWHLREVTLHTLPRALRSAINTVLPNTNNYMAFSIGGECSELTLVWHDALVETMGIPTGKNNLLRAVGSALGTTPSEARSTLTLFTAGTLEQALAEKVKTVVSAAHAEWTRYVKEAVVAIIAESYLPEKIFVFSSEAWVTQLFSQTFTSSELATLSAGDAAFTLHSLEEFLTAGLQGDVTARQPGDPTLLLFAYFCATLSLLPENGPGDPAGL